MTKKVIFRFIPIHKDKFKHKINRDWLILGFQGNGYITTTVLREILAALDDKLTSEDLDGIIEEIDEDGSGTIDFDGNCEALHSWNYTYLIIYYNL